MSYHVGGVHTLTCENCVNLKVRIREILNVPVIACETHRGRRVGTITLPCECEFCTLYRDCAPSAPINPYSLLSQIRRSLTVGEDGGVAIHVRQKTWDDINSALKAHELEGKKS